jgi:hypothetical protein
MKISFEVDQSKLFDVVTKYGTEGVISDIVGHLMTGKSGMGATIRMQTYGIEPLDVEELKYD